MSEEEEILTGSRQQQRWGPIRLPNPLFTRQPPPPPAGAEHGPRIVQLRDSELHDRAEAQRHTRAVPIMQPAPVEPEPAPVPPPWVLHSRVERRLHRRGLDRVSGDSSYSQHHFLDWIASFRITSWLFQDEKPWNALVIGALVVIGLALIVALVINNGV